MHLILCAEAALAATQPAPRSDSALAGFGMALLMFGGGLTLGRLLAPHWGTWARRPGVIPLDYRGPLVVSAAGLWWLATASSAGDRGLGVGALAVALIFGILGRWKPAARSATSDEGPEPRT